MNTLIDLTQIEHEVLVLILESTLEAASSLSIEEQLNLYNDDGSQEEHGYFDVVNNLYQRLTKGT